MCDGCTNVGARKISYKMKEEFVKVPLGGMTAEEVVALWQKGELYRREEKEVLPEEEIILRCQREALAYVAAIEEYAADEWQGLAGMLWKRIVNDEAFSRSLVMLKGRNKWRLNRYVVTNIVFHLHALDVYRCDSLLELHKKLEGVCAKNSIYKGAGEYKLNSAQRRRLRELREDVAGQK